MKDFVNPPHRKCNIYSFPQAVLQNLLTPLNSRPPPTAGLKMNNPLQVAWHTRIGYSSEFSRLILYAIKTKQFILFFYWIPIVLKIMTS